MPRRAPLPPIDSPPLQLLTVKDVAAALRVSYWCARDLVLSGKLARVNLPAPNGSGSLRRLLVDSRDLARLVEDSREPATVAP